MMHVRAAARAPLRTRARSLCEQLVVLTLLTACVHTEPFRSADGTVLPNSIASMESVQLGGIAQSIWIRGIDRSRPILILLHGGPGASESALFRHYDAEFEKHFVVVYWEQRGTGRSFHSDIPQESMTIGRMLRDLDELIEVVRQRFARGRVVLLGHSWGTVLGTIYAQRCPAKVAAYAGTGQIANKREGDRLGHRFALAQAIARENATAVEQLNALNIEAPSVDDVFTLSRWIERFGGAFRADLSTGKLIWAALRTDEASLVDLVLFGRGNRFSHEHLLDEFQRVDLTAYRRFEVPVLFLLGRHDMVTPSTLAHTYFETISAPRKRLIWFEGSAHNPPFEEPEKFFRVLVEEVHAADAGREGSQYCVL
jgi:proline iminopeptidase